MRGRDRRSLFRWENRRAQKVNTLLNQQLEMEAEQCPFKPELSCASRRIAKDYSHRKVHDRLLSDGKRRAFERNAEIARKITLTPGDFDTDPSPTSPAAKALEKTPRAQSARGHVSAFGGQMASQQAKFLARSVSPKGGKTERGPTTLSHKRASLAVMPAGLKEIGRTGDSRSVRDRKGGSRSGSSIRAGSKASGGDSVCSARPKSPNRASGRSGSMSPMEQPKMILPAKSAVTNGKNTVIYETCFADLMYDVHTGNMLDNEGSPYGRQSSLLGNSFSGGA